MNKLNEWCEPLIHSGITDALHEDHYLAFISVYCDRCGTMCHAFNNECMCLWIEFLDSNICGICFADFLNQGRFIDFDKPNIKDLINGEKKKI